MGKINKFVITILRIFVIVFIGGILTSNLMSYTFSANTTESPDVLVTINGDGSITQSGNLLTANYILLLLQMLKMELAELTVL